MKLIGHYCVTVLQDAWAAKRETLGAGKDSESREQRSLVGDTLFSHYRRPCGAALNKTGAERGVYPAPSSNITLTEHGARNVGGEKGGPDRRVLGGAKGPGPLHAIQRADFKRPKPRL